MRIIVADDHGILRAGIRAFLEQSGFVVVGDATTGHEALALARELRPDVVVMDIMMPDLNGIDATRRLRKENPKVKIIGLSSNADRRSVMSMLEAGASGYLVKAGASDELVLALRAVARGQTYLSPAIASFVVDRATKHRLPPGSKKSLSQREREVLQLLAEGKSSKEIAAVLAIALPTVETHRRQIMDKAGVRTIAELTKFAIREGLTSTDP